MDKQYPSPVRLRELRPAPLSISSCFNCEILKTKVPKPLGHCLRCNKALYCSKCFTAHYCCRKFQDPNWKSHQPTVPLEPGDSHNPGFDAMNHIFGLVKGDFLHNRPETEVFNLLIDSFKMRMKDEHVFGHNPAGIYKDIMPLALFQEFLILAESRLHLLPVWWCPATRRQCEQLAVNYSQGNVINCAVEKSYLQEHYKDNMMPLKLRVLNEKIWGNGFL